MLVDFQKKHGLTPDGKFGHITAKKIVEVFNIKHPAIFFGRFAEIQKIKMVTTRMSLPFLFCSVI